MWTTFCAIGGCETVPSKPTIPIFDFLDSSRVVLSIPPNAFVQPANWTSASNGSHMGHPISPIGTVLETSLVQSQNRTGVNLWTVPLTGLHWGDVWIPTVVPSGPVPAQDHSRQSQGLA